MTAVSSADATLRLTIPTRAENKFVFSTMGEKPGGIFDVSTRLHRSLGFEWRPIQKSSLLNTLCKHLKSCRTFLKHAIKANVVSLDDLVTMFYDHVPAPGTEGQNTGAFNPHWTVLINPKTNEAYIQAPNNIEEFNRQSLTGLLDICEEIGCSTVYASVRKDKEDMKNIVRAFMSAGFQIVPPTVKQMDGHLFLGYEL